MLLGKGLLTPLQQDFLKTFCRLPDQNRFYLSGGTALAEYYLGHRLSFDLDLFTSDPELILPVSFYLQEISKNIDLRINVIRRFSSYIEFDVQRGEENLKVDLALDSPFRFAPPVDLDLGVLVSDLQDLQVDKLLAFYGRAEPRDAVDLFFIFQNASINEILKLAKQKDPGFDFYWFSVALQRVENFPDEIDRWPVKMLQQVHPKDIKSSFLTLAQNLMKNLIEFDQDLE